MRPDRRHADRTPAGLSRTGDHKLTQIEYDPRLTRTACLVPPLAAAVPHRDPTFPSDRRISLNIKRKPIHLAAYLTVSMLAAACGGGGGGGGSDEPASLPNVSCSGEHCGAASNTRYSGSGVGLWHYANTSGADIQAPIHLSNLGEKSVTLVYTNTMPAPVAMPAITLQGGTPQANRSVSAQQGDALDKTNHIPERIREFDTRAHLGQAVANQSKAASRAAQPAPAYAVGNTRSWFVENDSGSMQSRTTTLRRQAVATDGRTINLWLENSEYGTDKISDTTLDTLIQRFSGAGNSVYNMVTGLAGQPWGTHAYGDLIAADQPIDIVFVNFDRNNQPYGLLGYFWSINNFVRDITDSDFRYSNESVSFYMDTETIYLDTRDGLAAQLSTLAHEFVHMINFYQRGVRMGTAPGGAFYTFDTFLEEMSALMMEDVVGLNVTPGYNSARDDSIPTWLRKGGYNCDLTNWNGSTSAQCFSYPVAASFGAHLLRHHGVSFYRNLLTNKSSTDSIAILDNAIKQSGGTDLATALQRWSTNIALLPATASPSGFGLPERIDGNFTLPAINTPDLLALRTLPNSLPNYLNAYGHFPFVRTPTNGVYSETLPIPAGVTLSVIVN